jgi:8-oxo-dGTP diphosphatase
MERTIRVVAAVIERDGCYLITQRRPNAVLPLLWEFPGGKVEEGETDAAALRREVHAPPRRPHRGRASSSRS